MNLILLKKMWKISLINYQGFNIKAFSLLETIFAIFIFSLLASFIYPRFTNFNEANSYIKLKAEYNLILSALSEYKTMKVLLNESNKNLKLDDALINRANEKLFSNVINFEVLSTSDILKEQNKWYKKSENEYCYFLNKTKYVEFKLIDSIFKCVSNDDICKKLY